MRKNTILLIFIILISSCSGKALMTPIPRALEYSYYKDYLAQYINDDILTIKSGNEGIKFVRENIVILNDLIEISYENIRNSAKYDLVTNKPEKRIEAYVSQQGVLSKKAIESENFKFDPKNPLSDESGYLVLSDISIDNEEAKVAYYTLLLHAFYDIYNKLDGSFIVNNTR